MTIPELRHFYRCIFLAALAWTCLWGRVAAAPPAPPLPGATVPGPEPFLWAPGLINTGLITRDVAMTPDMTEIYFCAVAPGYSLAVICAMRWDGQEWTPPAVAPFSGSRDWLDLEPFIAPDGRRFYFMSTRPDPDRAPGEEAGDQDIWVMDRTGDGWSPPRNLGAPVNTPQPEFFPAVTHDGTLYFTRADSAGVHAIWRARPAGSGFATPELLPAAVNCGTNRFNATIDPQESRLILTATGLPQSPGARYYLVRRNPDDTWAGPVDLGPAVNTAVGRGWSPYLSPDGRVFFFMSGRTNGPAEDPWPRTWSDLQSAHLQPGTGAGNIWAVAAGFLDTLGVQGPPPAPSAAPGAQGAPGAATAPAAIAGSAPGPAPTVARAAFPRATGAWLGQNPPGREPTVFAPGLVSTGLQERDILFGPDGDQAWYGVMDRGLVTIMTTRLVDGAWSEPVTAPFHTDSGFACFEPAFAAGGRTVLFLTNQAAGNERQGQGWANQNIFCSRLSPDGSWSPPQPLPPPVTTEGAEYFPSLARDGTLYFTREDSAGIAAIWVAEPAGGSYATPERLGPQVNCGASTFNATVEPGEAWIIACVQGRPDNLGPVDYWISFRDPGAKTAAGGWLPAVNLGDRFNGPDTRAASASLSPDGRWLFFSSQRRRPEERTRPQGDQAPGLLSWEDLLAAHASPGQGGSDIWWVSAAVLEDFR